MKSNGLRMGIVVVTLFTLTMAWGDAPVVDLSQSQQSGSSVVASASSTAAQTADANATTVIPVAANNMPDNAPSANLTSDQRLDRLERQMTNLANMNLPQQVSDLQGQIDQLRGQLQVEQHNLQLLTEQQKSFYQDVDQRISQLKNLGSAPQNSVPQNAAPVPTANNNAQLRDSNAYQAAFSLLQSKQYDKAENLFQRYLKDYPHGQYVVNAHYWLGEIYVSRKNSDKASAEFKTVIDQFPQSIKVPDAKLKLAILHEQAGDVAKARIEFLQIKQQHPGSTAAQLANIRLQELGAQ